MEGGDDFCTWVAAGVAVVVLIGLAVGWRSLGSPGYRS